MAEPTDWDAALAPLAKTKLLSAGASHDTLTISWTGDLPTLNNLPFARVLTLETVQGSFATPARVRPATFGGLPCLSVLAGNSRLYWTADSMLIGGHLQDSCRLLNHVRIGMAKPAFWRLFFTAYPAYVKNVRVVRFHTGIADNATCYVFERDVLKSIDYVDIPDG